MAKIVPSERLRRELDQATDLRQANRYPYVGADPINLVDPSGMKGLTAGGGCGLSAEVSRNTTGSNQRTRGSVSLPVETGKVNCSASAVAYTGEDDGGPSAGVRACAVYCVRYNTDRKFEFGFGFGVDASWNP